MQEVFPYRLHYWYPHMKPNDVAIWERFISTYPDAYQSVQYDFGIGDIPDFIANASSKEGQAMQELYRLKIDVVGFKDDVVDLVEIKPDARPSTIGQIQSYVALYIRDFKPIQKVQATILTNSLQSNMIYLCEQQNVKLIIV